VESCRPAAADDIPRIVELAELMRAELGAMRGGAGAADAATSSASLAAASSASGVPLLRMARNCASALPATSRATPMPLPATSRATPRPPSAMYLATPIDSSMRRFTSGGTGGGGGGVRPGMCDCTSRLPRDTKMPITLGSMSRT
jgi:hypothetical protein